MKKNNFSIENCECLNNKCPFLLTWWINSLKDKMLSNQNPPLKASGKAKNIEFLVKAKNDLNNAIKDKVLMDNQPEYISPTIILNSRNVKDKNKANKDIENKNKITKLLEAETFQDDNDDNNTKNTRQMNILLKNYIKINYIQQRSLLPVFLIIGMILIFIINRKTFLN